jgi:zinc transport system substrate-binding protein
MIRSDRGYKDIIATALVATMIAFGGALSFALIEAPSQSTGKLQVMTTFYPLYFFSSKIGGERADVRQLMPDNSEPHAWEPKPSDILRTDRSQVFVYNGAGFEPWVSNFISNLANRGKMQLVDTSVNLSVDVGGPTGQQLDPHFWLDPLSAKVQVDNILKGFISADPANATYFQTNAQDLKSRLDQLHHDFKVGLQNRTKNDIITTHEGFDYLALRYGFIPHAAVGISADQQPSPSDLANLASLVRSLNLHYVFSEPIFSDAVMQTIAAETGAGVLVLDGIHGRTGVHAHLDYFTIMNENIASLRIGLEVTA